MRLLAGWVVAIVKWKTYATELRCVPTAHAIRIVLMRICYLEAFRLSPVQDQGSFRKLTRAPIMGA